MLGWTTDNDDRLGLPRYKNLGLEMVDFVFLISPLPLCHPIIQDDLRAVAKGKGWLIYF